MKLIDKDKVAAEIEKRFDEYTSSILKHYDAYKEAKVQELGKILTIINTLETKEMDLDKEMAELLAGTYQRQYHHNTYPELSDNSEFVTSKEEIKEACMYMAEWKYKQMIEKAVKWWENLTNKKATKIK